MRVWAHAAADSMVAHSPLVPAIFLDKDGTLLEDVPYNVDPARMQLAVGADAALERLGRMNWPLVVISNQAGVAMGYFEVAALMPVVDRLRAMFASCGAKLAGCYFCPHHPAGVRCDYAFACECRKPRPGLLREAARELSIDLARSWMIGDILDDIEAGRRSGCTTVLLDNGNETEWVAGHHRTPHHKAASLDEASLIVERACAKLHTHHDSAQLAMPAGIVIA